MRAPFLTGLVAGSLGLAGGPALADHARWQGVPVAAIGNGGLWLGATPGGGVVVGSQRSPVVIQLDPRGRLDTRYLGNYYAYGPPGLRGGRPPGRAVGWSKFAPQRLDHRRAPPRYRWRDDRHAYGDWRRLRDRDCDD